MAASLLLVLALVAAGAALAARRRAGAERDRANTAADSAVIERDRANTAADLAGRDRAIGPTPPPTWRGASVTGPSSTGSWRSRNGPSISASIGPCCSPSKPTGGSIPSTHEAPCSPRSHKWCPDADLIVPFDAPIASSLRGFIPTGLRRVYQVRISADGRTVVVHGEAPSGDAVFAAYDVATRTEMRRLRSETPIGQVHVEPGGTFALVAGFESVEIVSLTSERRLRVVDVPPEQPGVREASLSPDGSTVGVVFDDGSVDFFSAATAGRLGAPLPPPIADGGRFGTDGSFVFGSFAPGSDVLGLHVWDVRAGEEIRTVDLVSPSGGSYSRELLFSPDMALLVGINDPSGVTGSVDVWDSTTGELVGDRGLRPNLARGLPAFVSDRIVALGRFDGQIVLYDLAAERVVRTPLEASSGGIYGLAATPDGRALVSVGDEGLIRIWGPDDRGLIDEPLVMGRQLVAVAADGTRFAVTTRPRMAAPRSTRSTGRRAPSPWRPLSGMGLITTGRGCRPTARGSWSWPDRRGPGQPSWPTHGRVRRCG